MVWRQISTIVVGNTQQNRGVYTAMFEQSVILSPKRNPWSMAFSLALQCSIVGAILLVSILHIEKLNIDLLRPPPLRVPLAKAKLDAVEIIAAVRSAGIRPTSFMYPVRPFAEPSRIPSTIAFIDDVGTAPPQPGSYNDRVGEQGSQAGIIGGISLPEPAPPPPPQHTPPAAQPKQPMRIASSVAEARLIHKVVPPYPILAKQMRISGTVRLLGVISTSGRIEKLEVIEGHPLLVKAAVEAVQQWIYRPTILNGEPVTVAAPIVVTFILNQ